MILEKINIIIAARPSAIASRRGPNSAARAAENRKSQSRARPSTTASGLGQTSASDGHREAKSWSLSSSTPLDEKRESLSSNTPLDHRLRVRPEVGRAGVRVREAKTVARLKLAHVRLALVHAIHETIQN